MHTCSVNSRLIKIDLDISNTFLQHLTKQFVDSVSSRLSILSMSNEYHITIFCLLSHLIV